MPDSYTGPEYQTVKEVWAACGRDQKADDDDAEVARVRRQIRIASRAVDRFCGRSFMHVAEVTRHYAPPPLPDLQIPDAATIASVTVGETDVPEATDPTGTGYIRLPLDSTEAAPLTTALRYVVEGVPTNWNEHADAAPGVRITVVFEAGPPEPPPEVVEVTEAVSVRLVRRRVGQHGVEDGYGTQTERVPVRVLVAAYSEDLADLKRPEGSRAPLVWEIV